MPLPYFIRPLLASMFCIGLALHAVPAAAASPPAASLKVVLTPIADDGEIDRLQVRLSLSDPGIAAGDPLLRMPVERVSTPTAAYAPQDILATDSLGEIALRAHDEAPTPSGQFRNYVATRATRGDVEVVYASAPRQVDAQTRNGPLFDLRSQTGGLMGAGVYFMALPPDGAPRQIELSWDLDALPEGARGVSSFGEGDQRTTASVEALRYAFYAVGTMQRAPEDPAARFHFYWMDTPPFDAPTLAASLSRLYVFMSAFFEDEEAKFRVFARSNPHPGSGGTSLGHSFMFGFRNEGQSGATNPDDLLAHEMVHTWPRLQPAGAAGDTYQASRVYWYNEGAADYYALLLLLRSGVTNQDAFLASVNKQLEDYYGNPFVNLSIDDAAEKAWTDSQAQRVPYLRGFIYLMNLDAQLRERGRVARSLDTLVLDVLRRQRAGEHVGLSEWRAMVVGELGAAAGEALDAVMAGTHIVPEPHVLGCFRAVPASYSPFELGFDPMRMGVVKDLQPDSAAERAGVLVDDIIVGYTPLSIVRNDPDTRMTLQLERAGKPLQVDYLPRGAPVESWRIEPASTTGEPCMP